MGPAGHIGLDGERFHTKCLPVIRLTVAPSRASVSAS
jgi:hypothetical protein